MTDLYYKSLPDNTVLSLIAPTASGKTDLAFKLFDTGRFELISVDSALIYEDMNIGTAKPTDDELVRFPHHLVNVIKPTETYNVATFCGGRGATHWRHSRTGQDSATCGRYDDVLYDVT